MEPKVSVVILNFNGQDLLPGPIESLRKQSIPSADYEIIVVDNGSSDESLSYLKQQKDVRTVPLAQNEGYSAFNSGIAAAHGEFIFLVNNDLTFHQDCLAEMLSAMESDPRIGMCSPLIVDTDRQKVSTRYLSRAYYGGGGKEPFEKKRTLLEPAPFVGLTFFRPSLVEELGGQMWDPDYFLYAEDIDISLRVRMLGYKVVQVNSAMVFHEWDGTISKHFASPQRVFLAERNLLLTFLKDADRRSLILYGPCVAATRSASLIADLLRLRFSHFSAKVRAYWWNLTHIRSTWRKRQLVQRLRKVPDKSFFPPLCDEKRLLKDI